MNQVRVNRMHYLLSLLTAENISQIPISIVISTVASMLGIGGGILWAPYLILIKKMSPQTAVMISFFIQSVGMGSAVMRNLIHKQISLKLGSRILPFILFGSILGSLLNQKIIPERSLEIGLGFISIIISISFAFQREKYDEKLNLNISSVRPGLLFRMSTSLFGVLSGIFSIGVGDFIIPLLRGKLKIPMRIAVGTSLMFNFSLAVAGAFLHFYLSNEKPSIDILSNLLFIWPGAFLGGQLGPILARRFSDIRLKEFFIFLMMIIGMHLVYQAL